MALLKRTRFCSLIALLVSLLATMVVSAPMATGTAYANNTTYYVDSVAGLDTNSGLTSALPWKTLSKVNSTTFQPGDRILFKSGSTWTGQLYPKGSGASGSPIVIDRYGSGNKPIINGGGLIGATVYLYNQQHWEINNLEVTNNSATSGARLGVLIKAENAGTLNHIYIKNMNIHNVKGDLDNKMTGGIGFQIVGTATPTRWNDILVESNVVSTVDRTGIFTSSTWEARGTTWTASTNVVIRNNTLTDIGGDGVTVRVTNAALVENNVLNGAAARTTTANAGFWPFNSDSAVFQYNEAYNTKKLSGNNDGMGFDIDWKTNGTIFQYNYSHDNDGGFMLICLNGGDATGFNTGGIVRFNISQNDRHAVFTIAGPVNYTHNAIYNNTIYVGSGSVLMVKNLTWGGQSTSMKYTNNIFYNLGTAGYSFATSTNNVFNSNIFYGGAAPSGASVTNTNSLTSDPLFANPGSGGIGRTTVDGYKLATGSPALLSGTFIGSNGGKDYWGNPVSGSAAPNRGAYNGAGVGASPTYSWTAVDDAAVRDGTYASTNQMGTTATDMEVKDDAVNYKREGYFKFDFNSYSGSVSSAVITLAPIFTGMEGIQNQVQLVSDHTWTEGAITWNTKPASSTVLATYTVTSGTPVHITVTSQVKAAMSAGKKLSIRVITTSGLDTNSTVKYATSENATASLRPKLVITP